MEIETQVAIVGGGPAGSATAIYLARRGISTVIIEKDSFPRYHIGESLTGEVGQRIRDLGLQAYMEDSKHPHKLGVNVYGPKGQHTFRVPVMERQESGELRPGQTWQVPRDEFDKRMMQQARDSGAQIVQGTAKQVVRAGEAVRGVVVETATGTITVRSEVLVDASGPATFLQGAGMTSPKNRGKYDKQLAVYSQLAGGIRNEGPDKDNTLILYRARNHWAWFIPLSETRVSVGVVVPSEYFRSQKMQMEDFFRQEIHSINPELKRRTPAPQLLEKVRGSSNYSYSIDRYTGNGFLCVGDAHRFIDPVFSFGLHFAIHEAERAAQVIAEHFGSGKTMTDVTFLDYQKYCDRGLNTIQELIDAFWNNPHAFAHAAHVKYKEDVIDMFAGRIYEQRASGGLEALKKINTEHERKRAGAC